MRSSHQVRGWPLWWAPIAGHSHFGDWAASGSAGRCAGASSAATAEPPGCPGVLPGQGPIATCPGQVMEEHRGTRWLPCELHFTL